ncbi:MAG: GNAT family N-acetyltransferase [Ruminococcaceae bacterium]|nr:GNAT family N-acetyltransferase [Oscillospiraceae bacterium]
MTIELRPPRPGEEAQLRALFTEAFGDADFTDLFFRTGFSPDRCLVAADGDILAAQHWFDGTLDGKKAAYLYGIAAFQKHRGKGFGSQLVQEGVEYLKRMGFEVILLVPAEVSLFGYYERFGFRTVSTICEERVTAGTPLPIRRLSTAEYAALRRVYLPEHSLLQEGPCLDLFSGYASFYATENAVAAVTDNMVWELLGDPGDGPGLLASLGLEFASVRTPGDGRPLAMAVGAEPPVYLGLALD